MAADSSIYFQQQTPDIMGSIQKGLSMRDMMDQRSARKSQLENDQAVKDNFKNNMTVGEDGSVSYNRQGLKDLAGLSPDKAMAMQDRFSQQDAAAKKAQQEQSEKQIELIARVAPQIKDQQSYEQAMGFLQNQGVDTSKMDRIYIPEVVNQYTQAALSAKDQMAQRNADRSYGLEREKLGVLKNKAQSDTKSTMNDSAIKLGKEWRSNPTTKATAEVATSYERIKKMIQNPSPAGDLSMVFNYMKMLDPGSVVRESEFKSAEQARGAITKLESSGVAVPAFLKQGVQKLEGEGFLLQEQRMDFADRAGQLFEAQMAQQKRLNEAYGGIAAKSGMDPSLVVSEELFAVKPLEGKVPPTPPPRQAGSWNPFAPQEANAASAPPILNTSEIEW